LSVLQFTTPEEYTVPSPWVTPVIFSDKSLTSGNDRIVTKTIKENLWWSVKQLFCSVELSHGRP
jgi:hypothetical protein